MDLPNRSLAFNISCLKVCLFNLLAMIFLFQWHNLRIKSLKPLCSPPAKKKKIKVLHSNIDFAKNYRTLKKISPHLILAKEERKLEKMDF